MRYLWYYRIHTRRAVVAGILAVLGSLLWTQGCRTQRAPAAALRDAVMRGDVARVQSAIAAGARADARGDMGQTLVHLAVVAGTARKDMLEILVKHGADVNAADATHLTALHYAVAQRPVHVVEALLDCGADPNAGGDAHPPVLIWAVELRVSPRIVACLLKAGAMPDAKDRYGISAREYATINGQPEILALFAEASK